jgi:hypothetical protein
MHSCCKKQRSNTHELFMRPYQGLELQAKVGFKTYNTDDGVKLRIVQRKERGVPASPNAARKTSSGSELLLAPASLFLSNFFHSTAGGGAAIDSDAKVGVRENAETRQRQPPSVPAAPAAALQGDEKSVASSMSLEHPSDQSTEGLELYDL